MIHQYLSIFVLAKLETVIMLTISDLTTTYPDKEVDVPIGLL